MALDRDKILHVAAKYVDKKKYDKAIAEYQKLISVDPKDARTLLKIGDLQTRMQEMEKAIATYDRVARIYQEQGFSLKAIAVFKQIKELLKNHAPQLQARYSHITPRLAEIYAQLNLVSDALSAYDEVATSYQKSGRDLDAIEVFKKTVALDKNNPLPYLRLAEACCRVKRFDEAMDAFWAAANLLLALERPDDALKVIERILHFKQDKRYAIAAAKLYLRHNTEASGKLALARLQIAFNNNQQDLEVLGLLAQAFEIVGHPERALAVHFEMAKIAHQQGEAQFFFEVMQHLKKIAPHHEQTLELERLGPPVDSAAQDAAVQGAANEAAPLVPPAPAPSAELPPASEAPDSLGPRPVTMSPSLEVGDIDEIDDFDDEIEYEDEGEIEDLDQEVEAIDDLDEDAFSLDDEDDEEGVAVADGVVAEEASLLEAEERGAPQSFQPLSHAQQAIENAEQFRTMGLLDKAVGELHIALELDPNSIPIRQKLREILVEAGEREGAIEETLNLAIIQIHHQDADAAEALALEILEIEPEHADAQNILAHVQALRQNAQAPQTRGHLDSYDLESVHPSFALNSSPSEAEVPAPAPLDDAPADAQAQASLESQVSLESQSTLEPAPPSLPRPSAEAIEEVLEEAEFFASQGLFEDAEAILVEMQSRAPDHILLAERLAEVRAEMGSGASSDTDPGTGSEDSLFDDQVFDIAASLDALDHLAEPEAADVLNEDAEVDVDLVFAKFKEGVKKTVDDSDAATHYDLGLAYKEMGLLPDAQSEFELASRDPSRAFMCHAMIGLIAAESGRDQDAIQSYLTALLSNQRSSGQEVSLRYDLALAYERSAKNQAAIDQYKAIMKLDAGYRDVPARLRALGGQESPNAESDAEDDFDAAFDNLLG